ncbi:endonuclease [Coraliomargarita sinensis]|uniref:Endonuclease n=1 Tax=Coraliomargarita sinensis TaxID=2174842 RepID=A0A317ZNB4_9BACT|nr:Z1 domain-containing protein [Coraliomargarita sinensis]PXA05723.1 endonuclease [Coraliomargarita sinensis]
MNKASMLIDRVMLDLQKHASPDEEAIVKYTKANALHLQIVDGIEYTEAELEEVLRHIKSQFVYRMEIGALFESEDYKPWLEQRQGDIEWYYWERYRKHLLTTKSFPPKVVRSLDEITDKILDRLEDPAKEGGWARRGLVVGHVQSGKTANYAGVVCKAADAGYQVIIVLAGLLNSLRNQTQERLDTDFMGYCTRLKDHVGASRFDKSRTPIYFTTSVEDFKKQTANSFGMKLDAVNEPVLFVLKKNKSTLENLHKWLLEHNRHNLRDKSMLLIDDEADHASINTNKDDKSPTAINRAIRDLLSIFDKSSFVGYTATPFANIFIDPDSEDEMKNGDLYKDLFPRDFILSLDPPDNYVGPHRIFRSEGDLDCIREIDDNEDVLHIKHKIDFTPEILPDSLHRAIECFFIAKAVRLLRGQHGKHHSMMVNASRFTRVQDELKGLILERVKALRSAIGNYASLPTEEAIRNEEIRHLHQTWELEFEDSGFSWEDIQGALKDSIDPARVISVNSASQDVLDYSSTDYPDGRTVIAVGGLGLSRGLTLEGLLVSYFLRNSVMYDTLMQMGRWFGYRDGYADLCRIFMTGQAESWYSHIAEATEELREDFRAMEKLKLTPVDFGLRVRSHPTALIVTARNKMRKGIQVPHKISLDGRLIETTALASNEEIIEENIKLTDSFITSMQGDGDITYERTPIGHLWSGVNLDQLASYIENFNNHPESFYTFYPKPLIEQLNSLQSEYPHGYVLLRTLAPKPDDGKLPFGNGLTGTGAYRSEKMAQLEKTFVSFKKKARMGESIDETAGLPAEEIEAIKNANKGKTINPRLYREAPGKKPLLIIHPLRVEGIEKDFVVGYGLSFPGSADSRRPQKLVEYIVNIPYWKNAYGDTLDEEEENSL